MLSIVDRERRRWGLHRRERHPAPKPVRGQLELSLTQSQPPRRRKPAPIGEPRAGQLALALTA